MSARASDLARWVAVQLDLQRFNGDGMEDLLECVCCDAFELGGGVYLVREEKAILLDEGLEFEELGELNLPLSCTPTRADRLLSSP